jgi:hypothetical protein
MQSEYQRHFELSQRLQKNKSKFLPQLPLTIYIAYAKQIPFSTIIRDQVKERTNTCCYNLLFS